MVRRILTTRGKLKRILRTPCTEVGPGDGLEVLRDLRDTLAATPNAAGLAAPQIGRAIRAFVVKEGSGILSFLNPKITERSEQMDVAEEGCLSIPGFKTRVARSTEVTISHHLGTTSAKGFRARVIQHEMDHLDGILITDHEARHA